MHHCHVDATATTQRSDKPSREYIVCDEAALEAQAIKIEIQSEHETMHGQVKHMINAWQPYCLV